MTSFHKLIAIVIIWIVCGGVLTVLFSNASIAFISGSLMVVLSVLILAAAVIATYFITRSNQALKM